HEHTTGRDASPLTHREPREDDAVIGANVLLEFEGACRNVEIESLEQLPGRYNYFLGNDASKWRTDVPGYSAIRYHGLYPGVDVVVRDGSGSFEYDLVFEPGADPAQIVVRCEGTNSIEVDQEGSLILHTAAGPLTQRRPDTHEVEPDGVCRT